MLRLFLLALLAALLPTLSGCKTEEGAGTPPSSEATTITLNPASTFQTMTGWEVPVLSTVLDYTAILPFMGPLMDQAVNDLGLTKMSIGIASGDENPSDECLRQYLNRAISEETLVRTCLYAAVNDNADPNVINPNGFRWLLLDWQIDNLVLPMKQRVEARGERFYLLLRYVDFGPPTSFEHYQNADEYAELMQAAFEHMRSKYGFTPDGIDVMNEPDLVAGWDPPALGRSIARTGQRLASLGYRPDFVAPSTTDKGKAASYFDAIIAVSGARDYLKDLSWHCYVDSASNSSAAIGARATRYGVRTSQTECWNRSNTYTLLHQELKTSFNSSWQLATIAGVNGYYEVNTSSGQATLRPKAQYIRQYFKYVRPNARRIDATSPDARFDPVTFVNANGSYVVIVKVTGGGSFSIANLPPGAYGVFYTTGPDGLTLSRADVNGGDQTVANARPLTVSMPATGVVTIYAKNAGPTPRAASGPATGGLEPRGAVTATSTRSAPAVQAVVPGTSITTRDGIRLRLEQVADAVTNPVDIAFALRELAFVAESDRIHSLRGNRLLPSPALVVAEDERLLAIAADPDFVRTRYLYAISSVGRPGTRTFALSRYREAANTLADRVVLLDDVPSARDSAAAALRFGPDGKLFVAFDDAGLEDIGGDLASMNGKVLRLNADGSTPNDQEASNPVFAYAYRSPRGLGWHPATRSLWIADAVLPGSIRLDVIDSTEGRSKRAIRRATFDLPVSIASSAAFAFYPSAPHSSLSNDLFIASEEGHQLVRIRLDRDHPIRVVAVERLLDTIGGIRLVSVGPDGAIYLGTANTIVRLVPEI